MESTDDHLKVLARMQRLVRTTENTVEQSSALIAETRRLLQQASDLEAKVWGQPPRQKPAHD